MGFQFMLILDLLGMYFDAAVVFVTNSSLFFRLAVVLGEILSENSCHFVNLLSFYQQSFFSQLEVNHVIQ